MLKIKWKTRLKNTFNSFNFHRAHQTWFGFFVQMTLFIKLFLKIKYGKEVFLKLYISLKNYI